MAGWQGGMHGRGGMHGGPCVAGGMRGGGVCSGGMHGMGSCMPRMSPLPPGTTRYGRSMRGRYASYWNVILLFDNFCLFFNLFRLRFRFRLV